MMIIEPDSEGAPWFHMPLGMAKREFEDWLELQFQATALLHRRTLGWREKRQMKKFLQASAANLHDRVEADQAFVFGAMPPQATPLVFFTKQFACDEEHSELHLSMLAEPDPSTVNGSHRVETVPFASRHFPEGLRCLRSWPRPDGGLMLSVAYAWNDPVRNVDLLFKGHYDDPALLEASFDAIDDFARGLRFRAEP